MMYLQEIFFLDKKQLFCYEKLPDGETWLQKSYVSDANQLMNAEYLD